MSDNLLKQSPDKPLYPDLLWSRPENKLQAGKLLIIGGNLYGFSAVGTAYQTANSVAGQIQVLLPDKLQKTIGKVFEGGAFGPSTPSGSFAKKSLAVALDMSEWSDGILLSGDFGRNSETAIFVEQLLTKYHGQLCITHDAIDYFNNGPKPLLSREKTIVVGSFAQIQKLARKVGFPKALTFEMDMLKVGQFMEEFTSLYPITIVTKQLNNIFVGGGGKVSVTNLPYDMDIWRVETAAETAVWQIQNPSRIFEAATCAIYEVLLRHNPSDKEQRD